MITFKIHGEMNVNIDYHEGKEKWMVDWCFNNAGGILGFYDTEDEAKKVLKLFSSAGQAEGMN